MKRIIISSMFIVGLACAGAGAYFVKRADTAPQIATVPVTRGDIVQVVSAAGTVEALTTVQVGSQVSGTVSWLGADFNSLVLKGQAIAKLDPSLLDAQLQQSRANLTKMQADVARARVQLADAQQKGVRAAQLAAKSLVAASELDSATTAVDSAAAQLRSAEAQVVQAKAVVEQTQVSLDHTIITAPIDGIVIQRSIDAGQTVAAGFSSPTLFVIAADLAKMQVNASIDESDIGVVRTGQAVTFTVDAYPGDAFAGTVSQVRLQPSVVENVTTYTAMIGVDNRQLKLRPGMTATARIEIAHRTGVLRAPNAAMRFKASADTFAALDQPMPSGPAPALWAYSNGSLTPVAARLGITDGVNTELLDASIDAGAAAVILVGGRP